MCEGVHKDAGAKNERRWTSYSRNATIGACSELNIHLRGLHKNPEARNERRCSCYPRNATIGACSGFILAGECFSVIYINKKYEQ